MAPPQTPKWPQIVSLPQASGKTRPPSTSQGSRTRVASWHGYGPRFRVGSQPRVRGTGWWFSTNHWWLQSDSQRTAIPEWEQGWEFSHLLSPGGALCTSDQEEYGQTNARGRSTGEVGESWHLCPGSLAAPLQTPRPESLQVLPLTPHVIVLVARWPEVVKLHLWTNSAACVSRWGRTSSRKDLCSECAANTSATRSGTAVMYPGVLLLVRLTS